MSLILNLLRGNQKILKLQDGDSLVLEFPSIDQGLKENN